jgi:hypothetical protein
VASVDFLLSLPFRFFLEEEEEEEEEESITGSLGVELAPTAQTAVSSSAIVTVTSFAVVVAARVNAAAVAVLSVVASPCRRANLSIRSLSLFVTTDVRTFTLDMFIGPISSIFVITEFSDHMAQHK